MSATHPNDARIDSRRSAFTLAEMLLVMVILGMLTAIAAPRYSGFVARRRVEAAARRVAADLSLAQRRARISSASQAVNFDVSGDFYELPGVSDPDHQSLAYKVSLGDEPYLAIIVSANFGGTTDVTFDGYGVPDSGGSVTVGVGTYRTTITVDPDRPSKPSIGPLTQ